MPRRILPCETCILARRAEPHTGLETVLKKLGLVEVCDGRNIQDVVSIHPGSEAFINKETVDFPNGGIVKIERCALRVTDTVYKPTVFREPAESVN